MSYYESPSDLYGKSFGFGSHDSLPKLRPDLVIREQTQQQETYYVIKDPAAMSYYKFSPIEWDIIQNFDGVHAPSDIVASFNSKHPMEIIDEETVTSYQSSLREMDLLEIPAAQKSLILMERIRDFRKKRAEGEGNLFYITFSAWDPDKFFDKVIPYLRWLWTKEFFAVSLFLVVLMIAVTGVKWDEFKVGLGHLYTFRDKSLWEIIVFIFLMTATGMFHEIGHGLTLKNFGGEVHKVGFLLFYLTPAFYCDVSDSYLIPSRRERLWVTFAGSYSELVLCSLASFVWFFAAPGTGLYDFAFKVVCFTGISSFLLNMNPLIKLDGYYALMDWLGLPDMREEAFAYVQRMAKKNVLRLSVEPMEELSKRKKRIYVTYAFFAICYTTFIYYLLLSWVKNIYVESFRDYAYPLLIITIGFLFRKKLMKAFAFMRFLYLDKKEVIWKQRRTIWLAGTAVVIFLLVVPRTHMKISRPFVIEAIQRAEIRFQNSGFVHDVRVRQNQTVSAGSVLAVLENPDLMNDVQTINAKLQVVGQELLSLQATGQAPAYELKARTRDDLLQQKADLDNRTSKLTVTTPISGTIVTPRPEEKLGTYAQKGMQFCEVYDLSKVKVQILVRDYEVYDVHNGQSVLFRTETYPSHTFEAHVTQISPASSERVEAVEGTFTSFRVTAIMDNPGHKLLPGMQGDAKILGDQYSIAERIGRELRRWIQSKVW